MPKIRIAALDLDGTLLSRENTVTPATRQAIADAVARGVVVLPATGRACVSMSFWLISSIIFACRLTFIS